MARPRTATNILEARGAFKANPNRARPNEPRVSDPFPTTCPDYLTAEQAACWREVCRLCPAGVLTGADPIVVEIVACLLAEFRRDPDAMQVSRITRLTSEMGKIGLTPSSRASLTVAQPTGNEFDEV